MRQTTIAVLFLAATTLGLEPAGALPPGDFSFRGPSADLFMGGRPAIALPLLLRTADLTPAQRARVHEIMRGHDRRLQQLSSDLRTATEALTDDLFTTGAVSREDVDARLRRVADVRSQLMREGVSVALAVREVLTPEQLTRAAEVHSRLKRLHGEMKTLIGEPF